MHPRLLALGLAAVLGVGGVAGCGGSDDESSSTSTPKASATVPDGKLNASVAPPALGFYAGVDCGSLADGQCSELFEASREGYHAYCKGGTPSKDRRSFFSSKGKDYEYFCFTLKTAVDAVDFWYAERKIVRNVHVSTDRFPQTCDNGYCVSGEWDSTRRLTGKIRNPNDVSIGYRAEWIGR